MIIEAIILGILQGLTEFLPISSSGHLILAQWATGWTGELMNNLSFDVALHVGTLIAVLWYFWHDWIRLIKACINVARGNAAHHEARLVLYIVLATIPAAVIGKRYEHNVETLFRNPLLVAFALVAGSLAMWLADRYSRQEHRLESMTLPHAVSSVSHRRLLSCLEFLVRASRFQLVSPGATIVRMLRGSRSFSPRR